MLRRAFIAVLALGLFGAATSAGALAQTRSGVSLLVEMDAAGVKAAAPRSLADVRDSVILILSERLRQSRIAGSVTREGADRIRVDLKSVTADEASDMATLLTQTGVLGFHLADPSASALDYEPGDRRGGRFAALDDELGVRVLHADPVLSNLDIADAYAFIDQYGRPAISMKFNPAGAKKLATVTAQNVGQPLVIVLDGHVISAPIIRTPIPYGGLQIDGSFTIGEAEHLAMLMHAVALPVKLTLVERMVLP